MLVVCFWHILAVIGISGFFMLKPVASDSKPRLLVAYSCCMSGVVLSKTTVCLLFTVSLLLLVAYENRKP